MAETVGSLVDKLSVANIRLWHLEDKRRDKALCDDERLKAADQVAAVNSQRNALIDELDELVDALIRSGKGRVCLKHKQY